MTEFETVAVTVVLWVVRHPLVAVGLVLGWSFLSGFGEAAAKDTVSWLKARRDR